MHKEKMITCAISGAKFKIIRVMADGKERTPTEICKIIGLKNSALSHLLSQMKNAGILTSRKQNRFIYYQMNKKIIDEIQAIKTNFEIIFEKL